MSLPDNFIGTRHSTYHSSFRVVVYRLDLGDEFRFKWKDEPSATLGEILAYDVSDPRYEEITKKFFDNPEYFNAFTTVLYDAIRSEYDRTVPPDSGKILGELHSGRGIFKEIDITPLVHSVSVGLELEALNSCNLVVPDTSVVGVDVSSFKRFYGNNKWYRAYAGATKNDTASLLDGLNSFSFREFDLIRVFTYGSSEMGIDEYFSHIEKSINLKFYANKALSEKEKSAIVSEKNKKLDALHSDYYHKTTDIKLRYKYGQEELDAATSSRMFAELEPIETEYNASVLSTEAECLDSLAAVDKKQVSQPKVEDEIIYQLAMRPAFTGVVSSIIRTGSVDNVSNISVQCVGLMRYLTQTSLVVDQALANAVVLGTNGFADGFSAEKAGFNLTANIFSGHNNAEIINRLMAEYFRPHNNEESTIVGTMTGSRVGSMGLPDSNRIVKSDMKVGDNNVVPMIQYLPNLLAMHLLKEKNREPIFYFDDMYSSREYRVTPNSSVEMIMPKDQYKNVFITYLTMLRQSMENMYDSTYASPLSVIEEMRSSSFVEVFEDRAGTIRFRVPRFNTALLDHYCSPYETISCQVINSDSNNFNVVQNRLMAPVFGSVTMRPPDVFADKLAAFRYGFRVAAPMENPNSTTVSMSKAMARFYRFYNTMKASRSAMVTKLGSPDVNVGDLVGFRLAYLSGGSTTFNQDTASDINSRMTYVGYVKSIREEMTVDGTYSQTLSLDRVRPANIQINSLLDIQRELPFYLAVRYDESSIYKAMYAALTTPITSVHPEGKVDPKQWITVSPVKNSLQANYQSTSDVWDLIHTLNITEIKKQQEDATIKYLTGLAKDSKTPLPAGSGISNITVLNYLEAQLNKDMQAYASNWAWIYIMENSIGIDFDIREGDAPVTPVRRWVDAVSRDSKFSPGAVAEYIEKMVAAFPAIYDPKKFPSSVPAPALGSNYQISNEQISAVLTSVVQGVVDHYRKIFKGEPVKFKLTLPIPANAKKTGQALRNDYLVARVEKMKATQRTLDPRGTGLTTPKKLELYNIQKKEIEKDFGMELK